MPGGMMSNASNAESVMRQPERWQVSEKAAEVYERYLVPTLLAPGGRLALSVWRALPDNPYNRALADAV